MKLVREGEVAGISDEGLSTLTTFTSGREGQQARSCEDMSDGNDNRWFQDGHSSVMPYRQSSTFTSAAIRFIEKAVKICHYLGSFICFIKLRRHRKNSPKNSELTLSKFRENLNLCLHSQLTK